MGNGNSLFSVLTELDELAAPAAAARHLKNAVDFSGSLDFIDNLPSGRPLALTRRDVAVISIIGRSRMMPASFISDNRRFNPSSTAYDPGEIKKGASRLIDEWIPYVDPDKPDRNYRVNTETGEIVFKPRIHHATESFKDPSGRLQFADPSLVEICLKRKIRREIMHALGIAGHFHKPKHFNPFSFVRC